MCGLAGVVAWEERYRVSREELTRMSACIAHRGPDGEGIDICEGTPQVGLVHRRLAILDPDPRSNQPFRDESGRMLVFNGEIYNFRDLKRELTSLRPDYQWRTTGDTEVLLLSYAVWGKDCLSRLDGMFAFAIWDEPRKELFLARDRMGQKPLYYAATSGAIAFGSEIPALCVLPWVNRETDREDLSDYLAWGFIPRGTIYRGVRKLSAGSSMVVREGHAEEQRWFTPNPEVAEPRGLERENAQHARTLILSAVQRQLVSDVPLGCFLSGGIDSSIIAASMRAAVQREQPVHTFSIGFDDPRYDETAYAAEVARHLGTEHHQFMVHPNAAEDLPRLAAVFGEPFGDSSALPTHYLSRETRKHVKVALSGDGGDELFGGYDRYRAMALGQRLGMVGRAMGKLAHLVPGTHPKSRSTRLRRLLGTLDLPPAQRYARYLMLFDPPALGELLGRSAGNVVAERYEQLIESGRDIVQAALAVDREIYLPDDLLTKVDRCSMLHALEVRSPFMDEAIVRFASTIPSDQLLRGGPKRLLRLAFAPDLPASVFSRRKMGFAVPIGEWFRTSLRPMLHDALLASDSFANTHFNMAVVRRMIGEHQAPRVDHSQRLYALLMLELWWRQSKQLPRAGY